MSRVIRMTTMVGFAALLLFIAFIEVIIMPQFVREALEGANADQTLLPLIVTWGTLVALPLQITILIAWKLTTFTRDKRIFSTKSATLVRALTVMPMISASLLLLGIIAAQLIGYTPPIVMYGLLGAMAFALTAGFALITMRRLLERATELSYEMDQVV